MHFSLAPIKAKRLLYIPLVVSVTLLATGCAHRVIRQVLPSVTLSDTTTKRNLVVGQVFFRDANRKLVDGPNLQSVGLVSHSVRLSPLSFNQPDITLGEFLTVIGGSSASCDASFPGQKLPHEGGTEWFQKEQHTVVGTEVSLLLKNVTEEVAEPQSLLRLLKEETRRSGGKVPWMPSDNPAYTRDTVAVAVVQALYAGQATLRFRVPENAHLPLASEYFLGQKANEANATVSTLIKMTSLCGAQAHARELPDPGVEAAFTYLPQAAGLVRLEKGRAVAMTPVDTKILLYEEPRLPTPTYELARLKDGKQVWAQYSDTARKFLSTADDHPNLADNSVFFKYCHDTNCGYAILTDNREFNPENGHADNNENRPHGCVFGEGFKWYSFPDVYKRLFRRQVALRELVLFFGPQPKGSAGIEYNHDTYEWINQLKSDDASVSKSGPTTYVWVYEYDCEGGIAELRPHGRPLSNLGVYEHLKGWKLDY